MTAILSGEPSVRYGAWTIIREAEIKTYKGKRFRQVLARCDCGNEKVVHYNNLRQGKSTKCFTCSKVTHGFTNEPEYAVWDSMLARCNNPKNDSYQYYGGRGITVCNRWNPKEGGCFENFLADMGRRPSSTHQLDKEAVRMDSMEYSPETTRWVPRYENCRRKRNCRRIEFNGECMTAVEWSQRLNLGPWLIKQRLGRGWSVEKALTAPTRKYKQSSPRRFER